MPFVQTTFNNPTPYSETPPSGDSADVDPWDQFLEEEESLVEVKEPRQYGLPRGFAEDGGEERDTYRVAAWNQLRCLVGTFFFNVMDRGRRSLVCDLVETVWSTQYSGVGRETSELALH